MEYCWVAVVHIFVGHVNTRLGLSFVMLSCTCDTTQRTWIHIILAYIIKYQVNYVSLPNNGTNSKREGHLGLGTVLLFLKLLFVRYLLGWSVLYVWYVARKCVGIGSLLENALFILIESIKIPLVKTSLSLTSANNRSSIDSEISKPVFKWSQIASVRAI